MPAWEHTLRNERANAVNPGPTIGNLYQVGNVPGPFTTARTATWGGFSIPAPGVPQPWRLCDCFRSTAPGMTQCGLTALCALSSMCPHAEMR
eukprot:3671756-Rhodomonas_salina.1